MKTTSRGDVTEQGNLTVVRRLMEEVLREGHVQLLPTLIAPEYIGHLPIGDHYGPEGVRIEFAAYRAAIRHLTVTLDDLFAADDRVARRFTLRGTLQPGSLDALLDDHPVILHGIAIDRLAQGRLVESWVELDDLLADRRVLG